MKDNVAEWLRRQPAKLMGFARVGSNPTVVVFERESVAGVTVSIAAFQAVDPGSIPGPRIFSC